MGDLERRVRELESVATGQAAMIACLTGLLVTNGSLEPERAVLVAAAGMAPPPGLSPKKIQAWLHDQMQGFAGAADRKRGTEGDPAARCQ